MTPLDLTVLSFLANDTCSVAPYPAQDGEHPSNNTLRVDLSGHCQWEHSSHIRHSPLPSWTPSDVLAQGIYVDAESELLHNLLSTLTFTPDPESIGLPQAYPPQDICAASAFYSALVSNDAPQHFPSEMRLFAPRLPVLSLPSSPFGGSSGPLIHQPAVGRNPGHEIAQLCISPSLLHAPSPDIAATEVDLTLANGTAPRGTTRRSSRKSHRVVSSSQILPRTRPHQTKPYTPPYPPSFSPSSAPSQPSSTAASQVVVCTRRNFAVRASQFTSEPVPSSESEPVDPWKCPHCPYVQRNHRTADLRRHIGTHTTPRDPANALWVCCGVPLWDALAGIYGPEAAKCAMNEEPFDFHGHSMVGGCRKAFCREDALRRHLRKQTGEGRCLGDEKGVWQPGNKPARGQQP